MKPFLQLCIKGAAGIWLTGLHAADPQSSHTPDLDLPQPLDASGAEQLLANPPFSRTLNWADSLVLTGLAYIQGKPVATIEDKANKRNYVVSEEPNEQGWRLQKATAARSDFKRTEVRLLVGGETVTIRYGDQQLSPEAGKKNSPGPGQVSETYTRDGQTYIRSSFYMTEEQRNRYRALPNEVREKFREIIRHNSQRLLTTPVEERETFVRGVFDKFQAGQKQ